MPSIMAKLNNSISNMWWFWMYNVRSLTVISSPVIGDLFSMFLYSLSLPPVNLSTIIYIHKLYIHKRNSIFKELVCTMYLYSRRFIDYMMCTFWSPIDIFNHMFMIMKITFALFRSNNPNSYSLNQEEHQNVKVLYW